METRWLDMTKTQTLRADGHLQTPQNGEWRKGICRCYTRGAVRMREGMEGEYGGEVFPDA
ncbi:hypothetical protein D3870_11470 [Noviherbaspirillum cavernae]|uniref:Uncharacterized protein n=1 Tax=Noviherbaspirillum cavernae TaxID=2320862 RepID=A0A418X256_9BURK|nr:hypothetical protein D3870_11470 [Noviherbaspirillum cavernae]